MVTLFKYQLAFVMTGGEADVHIEEIEADGYDNDTMGDGEHAVPSVVFEKMVPDPDDADEQIGFKVFEVPAHRIVYIKHTGDLPGTAEDAGPAEQADAPTKDAPAHGGYPEPDQGALRQL